MGSGFTAGGRSTKVRTGPARCLFVQGRVTARLLSQAEEFDGEIRLAAADDGADAARQLGRAPPGRVAGVLVSVVAPAREAGGVSPQRHRSRFLCLTRSERL